MTVTAVVFDWAGTMIDFGSCAPVEAMQAVFEGEVVPVDEAAVRRSMGMAKREHVEAILAEAETAAAWRAAKGDAPTSTDVDRIMAALEPAMQAAADRHATLIPGAADVVAKLRAQGVRIGSTTGYTRSMMAGIIPAAAEQGYAPDVVVCAGEVVQGRPAPLLLWRALGELAAWPVRHCIAVDDAPVGIVAGRNAGLWTVGVAASGNGCGLGVQAFAALDAADQAARMAPAIETLRSAGADFIVPSVADLLGAIERIEAALAEGESPGGTTVVIGA